MDGPGIGVDPTVIYGTVVALGGGVIAYLLRENTALKGEKEKLLRIIYTNSEAMKKLNEAREREGS